MTVIEAVHLPAEQTISPLDIAQQMPVLDKRHEIVMVEGDMHSESVQTGLGADNSKVERWLVLTRLICDTRGVP